MIDSEYIRMVSARTGLGMKFLSKEDKISSLLSQIGQWGLPMALKGGSAMNRVYIKDMARFSEDIDIDVFGEGPVDKKLARCSTHISSLSGFDVQGPRIHHLTARFDAYYENEFGQRDRVMIDLYLANDRPHSIVPVRKELVSSKLIETSPSLFPCYSLEDLVAQKLMAVDGRREGKDIYDLNFALELEPDAAKLIGALEKRMALRGSGISGREHLARVLGQRDAFMASYRMIMSSTNHYIPRSRRPDWRSFMDMFFERIRQVFAGYL